MTVTSGTVQFDAQGNVALAEPLQQGAVNVIATGWIPSKMSPGGAQAVKGSAVIVLAMDNPQIDESTLPHELAHVFLGHIYQTRSTLAYAWSEFVSIPYYLTMQSFGMSVDAFREGARKFSVPPEQTEKTIRGRP